MSTGANLEETSLKYLDAITAAGNSSTQRQNAVLASSAERLVRELGTVYNKIGTKGTGASEAQQLNARLNNLSDLLSPAERKGLTERMQSDLRAAEKTGNNSAKDLAKILGATSDTIKQNAKPNLPAIDNAGKRLDSFWAKENSLFRDRVTAMTQAAAAEGKSWRKLAGEVRELLLLERKAGTESARSQAVNARLGISARAELIARTELQTAYVQGQIGQYRENGYEWVRWIAAAERSCPYCISRDGLVYELGEIEAAIPAHPRCRCSLAPTEPPANWKRKGADKGIEAVESLDDAYWSRSRANKLREFRESNPRFTDADLRRYVNTPTNAQQYLRPGVPAPQPVWAPSGSLSPNLEAVVKAGQAAALKAAKGDSKPAEAPKGKQESAVPQEIIAAGLEPAWKSLAGYPEQQRKLLEKVKEMAVNKSAKDAQKAKEAEAARKKAEAAAKAAEVKKAGIKSLETLGLSTAQATKAWERTIQYANQGMNRQQAAERAIKDVLSGKKGKPVDQNVLDRIQRKQLIDPKGHGKVGKADIASAFELLGGAAGEAGANFRRLIQFQERHNITSIWGIGGKDVRKGTTEHLRSKQLLSSVNSALARKDGQTSYMTQVQKELRKYVEGGSGTGLVYSSKILKVDGDIGVGGSTGQGFGFIKVRLDGKSAKLGAKEFAKYQDDIIKGIEAAGKGAPLNNTNSAGMTWKKAGKYMVQHSDTGWVNTYIHEMGHQVHYMAGAPVFKGKYKPSAYGGTNHKEWFAETFVQYTVAPQALKGAAPDAYAFIDKVMKRVMQSTPGQWSRYNQNKTGDPTDFFNKDLSANQVKALKSLKDLQAEAKAAGLKGYSKLKKTDLQQLLNDQAQKASKSTVATPSQTAQPAAKAPAKPGTQAAAKAAPKVEAPKADLKGLPKPKKSDLPTSTQKYLDKVKSLKGTALQSTAVLAGVPYKPGMSGTQVSNAILKKELEKLAAKAVKAAKPETKAAKAAKPETKAKLTAKQKDAANYELVKSALPGVTAEAWAAKSAAGKASALKIAKKKLDQLAEVESLTTLQKPAKSSAFWKQSPYKQGELIKIAKNTKDLTYELAKAGLEPSKSFKTNLENLAMITEKEAAEKQKYLDGLEKKLAKEKADEQRKNKEWIAAEKNGLTRPAPAAPKFSEKFADIESFPIDDRIRENGKDAPSVVRKGTGSSQKPVKSADFEHNPIELGYSRKDWNTVQDALERWTADGYTGIRGAQLNQAFEAGSKFAHKTRAFDFFESANGKQQAGYLHKAELLEDFIARAPKYEGKVHRGVNLKSEAALDSLLASLKDGNASLSMESWSSSLSKAREFAEGGTGTSGNRGSWNVLMVAPNKHGVSIDRYNRNGEGEVLQPQGVRYDIKRIRKKARADGTFDIVVELLPRD